MGRMRLRRRETEPTAASAGLDEPADAPDPTPVPDPEPDPEPEPALPTGAPEGTVEEDPPFSLRNLTPLLLLRAAHPRQTALTAVFMAIAAALSGRAGREVVLVLGTVLVGQAILGWVNDLVDRGRDARHGLAGKPVGDGRLDAGTVWFTVAVAVFAVVPLSIANGVNAGSAYLLSLLIGLVGTWPRLRRGFFSWVPWAAAFALYPAFLSYGGWGGQHDGAPPEVLMTVLAALLGVGVHVLVSLWGLVPDNADGWTYLPLKLGLRLGASRLLWVTGAYLVAVLVAMAFAATYQGLSQPPL